MLTLLLLNNNALPEISGAKLKGHQKLVNRKSKKPLIVKGIIPNGLYTQVNNIDGIESHVVLKVLYVLWKQQLKNMEDNNFKYFPLSREYKIKILNGNKARYGIFKQLVDRGILYSTSYSTTRNQCKYVKLNPEYTKGEMVEIFYTQYYRVEANVDPSVQKVVEALTKLDLPHKNLSGIQELVKSKRTNIEEKIQSEITFNGKYRNKKIRKTQIQFVQDKVKEISNIHITRLYRLLDLKTVIVEEI
ncbi:MAG: hypothetical protein IPL25_08695 [Saprospiraceae bacterium]|nr:hypothetical protein [Candidatus Vicinibacter affinis]